MQTNPDLDGLLAEAPARDKCLVEWRLALPTDLDEALTEAAFHVRLFIVTWDPFEWREQRQPAMATVIGRGVEAEAVLYVPFWKTNLGDLHRWASSMTRVFADQGDLISGGSYGAEAFALRAPGLLSAVAEGPIDGLALTLETEGWVPLGHGAIEDMAAAEFGPLAMDRTSVSLDPLEEPEEGCVACAGGVFAFPAELNGNIPAMCRPHRAVAFGESQERFDAAAAASPDTWEAVEYASELLDVPHIPRGLRSELLDVASDFYERTSNQLEHVSPDTTDQDDGSGRGPQPTDEQLDRTLALFNHLAAEFGDEPADFELAVADDIELLEDYLSSVSAIFRHAGRLQDALAMAGMVGELMPSQRWIVLLDRAEIRFEQMDTDGAYRDLEEAIDIAAEDEWVTYASAATLAARHGSPERADAWYRQAIVITKIDDEVSSGLAVTKEYLEFLEAQSGREADAAAVAADLSVWDRRIRDASRGMSVKEQVGRNDRCPCGSGKKFKHCCGR